MDSCGDIFGNDSHIAFLHISKWGDNSDSFIGTDCDNVELCHRINILERSEQQQPDVAEHWGHKKILCIIKCKERSRREAAPVDMPWELYVFVGKVWLRYQSKV